MNSLSQALQYTTRMSSKLRIYPTCRIQYASDLHLEHYDKQAFSHMLRPAARILVLAGDIGNPEHKLYGSLLNWCHDKWDHVFVVAGNHEFYNKKPYFLWNKSVPQTYDQRLSACRNICSQWPNVHFMEKDEVYLEDYNTAFLGTTLWTHIPEESYGAAIHMVNDYNYIAEEGVERFSPTDSAKLHKESVQWLNARIHEWEEKGKHVVVISHHVPSQSLISERYKGHPSNLCFVTNLDEMIRPPVRAWICGHSHHQKEVTFSFNDPPTSNGRTILGLNAFGYNAAENSEYNPEKVLSFDCSPPSPPELV